MKTKQIKELRTKTKEDLQALIEKTQQELIQLQVDLQAGQLKNVRQLFLKKRDLARIKTILKELS